MVLGNESVGMTSITQGINNGLNNSMSYFFSLAWYEYVLLAFILLLLGLIWFVNMASKQTIKRRF